MGAISTFEQGVFLGRTGFHRSWMWSRSNEMGDVDPGMDEVVREIQHEFSHGFRDVELQAAHQGKGKNRRKHRRNQAKRTVMEATRALSHAALGY